MPSSFVFSPFRPVTVIPSPKDTQSIVCPWLENADCSFFPFTDPTAMADGIFAGAYPATSAPSFPAEVTTVMPDPYASCIACCRRVDAFRFFVPREIFKISAPCSIAERIPR